MAAAGFRAAALALALAACTSIAVTPGTFEGTRWRVTAIDGTATPNDSAFTMSFGHGIAAGQFGCNRGSGTIQIIGDTMIPGRDWIITVAACLSEDRMRLERDGFDVLSKPMRITWRSGHRVTLNNAAGSIDLALIP